MVGSMVTGFGAALPDTVVTNAELESRLDTSDRWIRERTGIRERRVGGTTQGLALRAGREALERSQVDPGRVGLVLVSTNTPDQPVPPTASYVQAELGLTEAGIADVNSGCSGFVYGLVMADALVTTAGITVLLVASDTVSRIVDPEDRSTAILFGDAAGAVVLEPLPGGPSAVLGWDLGGDGRAADLITQPHGGYVHMAGHEVFRRAVRASVASAEAALARAKTSVDDLALFVPHQANWRIIDAVADRLGIGADKVMVTVDRLGNTSSASIPEALAEAAEAGRLGDGDLVLLCGFGAGMTWASAVLRWGHA
jgi:3-oxoacyl-[acyl-carrier-protein] synthase-3